MKAAKELLTEPSIQQLNDVRVKHMAACKSFHDLWNVTYSESQSLMEKIKEQVSTPTTLYLFVDLQGIVKSIFKTTEKLRH